ncbi:glycoside hydrolase family 26 protein [Gonapodya prolifera JEL478]|uniref:Glycoside hydrolase family 26 protein n=1 Tax=Gonapodya prolifera (strain JEL478) TaxID=1344416 RepID=A0A139ARY3_GONPJ|nr:glycoside hydrolase family 26 protein [Gonapodya prolifera JEL478]|eukprot:KXS19506.1 glycoside hydrolase family 26 protein [Gonapodya prolifera JEL478]
MSRYLDPNWDFAPEMDSRLSPSRRKGSRSGSRSRKSRKADVVVASEDYWNEPEADPYEDHYSSRDGDRDGDEWDQTEYGYGDQPETDAVASSGRSGRKKRGSSRKHRRKRSKSKSKDKDREEYVEQDSVRLPEPGLTSDLVTPEHQYHDIATLSPQWHSRWDEPPQVMESSEPSPLYKEEETMIEGGLPQARYPAVDEKPKRRRWLLCGVIFTVLLLAAGGAGAAIYFLKFRPGLSTSSNPNMPQAGSGALASDANATKTAGATASVSSLPTLTTATPYPPAGKMWFGVAIDEDFNKISDRWTVNNTRGVMPKLVCVFWTMDNHTLDPRVLARNMTHYASNASELPVGSIIEITLMPSNGLVLVTDDLIKLFADAFRVLNEQYAVIVRFGHEMNGAWYTWLGRQPTLYKSTFRRLATVVHATAPATAMLWAPTIADTYPYATYNLPPPNTTDFEAVDTNKNGAIDSGDDPYAPYYPGDDVVDWVGGTVYHYGPTYPYVNNFVPPRDYFDWTITGKSIVDGTTISPSFYDVYATAKNKPFMLGEVGIYHWQNGTGADALSQKQAWWRILTDRTTRAKYPLFRALAWFEVAKIEPGWNNQYIDFTIGLNSTIVDAFLTDISTAGSTQSDIDPTSLEWAIDYRQG